MTKTYAVTGVANGIGAELARKLKLAGHRVLGFDVQASTDYVDKFIAMDLNDSSAIAAAARQTPWPLDGLCNNAGVPPRAGIEQSILQVNFTGTRAFTQAMLPRFNSGASIVNMASRAGHGWSENIEQIKRFASLTQSDQLAQFIVDEKIDATRCYNLSKETLLLWTTAIAEEMVARDIRVNSLSPGGVATGILDDFKRAFGDKMAKNVARAGRPGNPGEIADVAAFVLSPQSNWLKGSDIAIDGGMGAFNLSDQLGLDALRLPETELS